VVAHASARWSTRRVTFYVDAVPFDAIPFDAVPLDSVWRDV
jgi:hypothetical protein